MLDPLTSSCVLPDGFLSPPGEYSMMPFWFLNDVLEEKELQRQIASFQDHGIEGFVLHPRVGLPRDMGWMSDRLLYFLGVILKEAARRGMTVILYDEGMYPSGSSSGQVVEENSEYACRGLLAYTHRPQSLPCGSRTLAQVRRANGETIHVIDQPLGSWMRGLHYLGDDSVRSVQGWPKLATPEERPPAADLLNPHATACFIRKVYERYHEVFGEYFGKTIPAIFTDEPMVLGRGFPPKAMPGTTDILEHVNRILGYDFTPHLPALWWEDEPDAWKFRADYLRAIQQRLRETYYGPLRDWCQAHHVALTGHPATPQDIGHLHYFHWPGQDTIWREIMPGEAAVTGVESTAAKCAASVAVHQGRRRNLSEFMGAYGHDVPMSLYQFVAGWLLVRGCNLLVPHAYYYSVRGPRVDECPPQLGPHSPWWNSDELRNFHHAVRRLSWLNTDCHVHAPVALLCTQDRLPLDSARYLFEHQIDFHYLDVYLLTHQARINDQGIFIADQHYQALIHESDDLTEPIAKTLDCLVECGRLVKYNPEETGFSEKLRRWASPTVRTDSPQPWLRARRVVKEGRTWILLYNEGIQAISTCVDPLGPCPWLQVDVQTGQIVRHDMTPIRLELGSGQWCLLATSGLPQEEGEP